MQSAVCMPVDLNPFLLTKFSTHACPLHTGLCTFRTAGWGKDSLLQSGAPLIWIYYHSLRGHYQLLEVFSNIIKIVYNYLHHKYCGNRFSSAWGLLIIHVLTFIFTHQLTLQLIVKMLCCNVFKNYYCFWLH